MSENQHIDLYQQLSKYPEDFSKAMQIARESKQQSVINYILDYLNYKNEWDKLKIEEQSKLTELMTMLYSFGFYDGVSFSLDPDKYLEVYYKNDNKK